MSSWASRAISRRASKRVARARSSLDLGGLTRLFGDAKTIAAELRRTAADRGLRVRIAIAGTRTAARLLAHGRAGITIVEPGDEAAALESLPLALLARITNQNDQNDEPIRTFRTLRTIRTACRSRCAGGDCDPWETWRRCHRMTSRPASAKTVSTGSALRAARIQRRSCRRFRKNASSRRSISNGPSRGSSRCRSCWRG